MQLPSDDSFAKVLLTNLRNLKTCQLKEHATLPLKDHATPQFYQYRDASLARADDSTHHLFCLYDMAVCYLYSERVGETLWCLKMQL